MKKPQRNSIEDKLQAEIVLWFGQTWPQYQNLLFEVNNNPANIKHAMHRRAMGMRAGVSDLILIQPNNGICHGIELKAPGSSYNYSEIEHQIKWGEFLSYNGGYYIMSSNIELIKDFITGAIEKDDRAYFASLKAKEYIDKQLVKMKTIKF